MTRPLLGYLDMAQVRKGPVKGSYSGNAITLCVLSLFFFVTNLNASYHSDPLGLLLLILSPFLTFRAFSLWRMHIATSKPGWQGDRWYQPKFAP